MKKLTEMAEGRRPKDQDTSKRRTEAGSQTKDIPVCNGFRRFYCSTLRNSGLTTSCDGYLKATRYMETMPHISRQALNDLLEQFEHAHDNLVIEPSMRLRRKIEVLTIAKDKVDLALSQIEDMKKRIGLT